MKTVKLFPFLFFLLICSITNGQTPNIGNPLDFKQMGKLVQSVYYSDTYLLKNNFKRLTVQWINNDGYLATQYVLDDKTSIIEIGSSNDFINCIIATKESNYVNFLIAEAYNDNFIKDKDLTNTNGGFPIVLRKGKLQFGVSKDQKGVYKISLNRDYQTIGWHFVE
jgi:hypothetical protein